MCYTKSLKKTQLFSELLDCSVTDLNGPDCLKNLKLNTVFWALLLYLEIFVFYKVMYKDEENYSSTPLVLTLNVISLS